MPDGSLVYQKKGWEPPPEIEGYERDPGNAWVFRPLYPECETRSRVPQLKRCGSYNVIMLCTNQECPLSQQKVSVRDCQACPFRQALKGS